MRHLCVQVEQPARRRELEHFGQQRTGGRQDPGRQDGACWRESAACRFLETDLFFPIGKTGLAGCPGVGIDLSTF